MRNEGEGRREKERGRERKRVRIKRFTLTLYEKASAPRKNCPHHDEEENMFLFKPAELGLWRENRDRAIERTAAESNVPSVKCWHSWSIHGA